MARRRLLYIGGWGRSGSSILANVLGSHAQIASLGEVRYVWDRGVIEDKVCGCGESFSRCAFWQRSFTSAGLSLDPAFAAGQAHAVGSGAVNRQLRAMLTNRVAAYAAERSHAVDALRRLYVAAADAAESEVLVDASKLPPYAINLDGTDAFELTFIHLVRDPRAVAFSWSRKMQTLEARGEYLPRYSALKSSAYWSGLNALSTWFRNRKGWSYLLVHYEDFCRHPRATVNRILEFCDLSTDGIQWYDEHTLEVVPQHSISGNPSRFAIGRVRIALDDEWTTTMRTAQRRIVTALTAPVAASLGLGARGNAGERDR